MTRATILLAQGNLGEAGQRTIPLLEGAGYRVVTASGGAAVLRIVRRVRPSLVLLDAEIREPSGLEVLRELRADPALGCVSVVWMCSGARAAALLAEGLDAGAEGAMAYPIADAELLARVRAHLRQRELVDRLLAGEARYRAIVESEPECVKIVASDGRLLDMNPAGLRMVEADDLGGVQGRPVLELIHPEDRPSYIDLHRRASQGQTGRLEFRLIGLKGTERWMETHSTPLRAADGSIDAVLSVTRDITDKHRAEQDLRHHATLLQNAQRIGRMGSWSTDLPSGRLHWSDATCALFGIQPSEFGGTLEDFTRFVLPEDRPVLEAARARMANAGLIEAEFRIRRADGEIRWMYERGNLEFDETGRAIRRLGMVMDITERKQAEEKLREQATLLDRAQDAILVRDLDHRVLYWNKSAERLYGWAADEVLGRSVRDVLYRDPVAYLAATSATLEKGEWVGEIEQYTRHGKKIVVEGRWTRVCDDGGQPQSVLAINTDVTDRKKLEQQFLRAQRMESIGTLAGGIAHDLNNVLAPILMSTELLKLRASDPESRELLESLARSARRGAEMVRQVLTFARGVEGERVDVPLRPLIRDLVRIMSDTFPKNIQVETRIQPDHWVLRADPTQLQQVLMNLCVNARDAMPEGGRLTVSVENRVIDEHYAATNIEARVGPHVKIEVEDTGTGIPPDIIEKIFDPFFTTKEVGQGTGLGLPTTLAIVKSHGGFIRVYSEPGVGSCFRVFLPAEDRTVMDANLTAERPLRRGNGETILVIDDEASIREVTQQTLEAFGYRVLLAANGVEGVAQYAQRQAEIAVVLTDMMMPVMDGPSTIQVLRRMNPSVRIIAASGISGNGLVAQAAGAGVRSFLPKPYTAELLLNALAAALERGTPTEPET